MKFQLAAAAPGVEFPAQTCCKAWQDAQSCSGELCPQCPHCCVSIGNIRRNSLSLDRAHITHTSTGSAPLELQTMEGRWSLVRSRRTKRKCHTGSSSATDTDSGSVGRGSIRFPYGRVWAQELLLIHLKIPPFEHPQLGISQ